MPRITYKPLNQSVDVEPNTKILAAAVRSKIPIRYGCGACRCGTCGVKISGPGEVSPMAEEERKLLSKIGLNIAPDPSGQIRLACRTKVIDGEIDVDLSFQDTYSPSVLEEDDDDENDDTEE